MSSGQWDFDLQKCSQIAYGFARCFQPTAAQPRRRYGESETRCDVGHRRRTGGERIRVPAAAAQLGAVVIAETNLH